MSNRPGGRGSFDIWESRRDNILDPWQTPANLGSVINQSGDDRDPAITGDGLNLLFVSNRSGNFDIWRSVRETLDSPWKSPVRLMGEANSLSADADPDFVAGMAEVIYASDRAGGFGALDIWQSRIIPEPCTGLLLMSFLLVSASYSRSSRNRACRRTL